LKGLEVENKSATPYSSKRARGGPEMLKIIFAFSFLLSTALDPNENRGRIDRQPREEMTTVGTSAMLGSTAGGDCEESRTRHSLF
jgi:hypothetical protein